MKYTFVTSFNEQMYESFAKEMLQTWVMYLPQDCKIVCWIEGPFPRDLPVDSRFEYKMLDSNENFQSFIKKYGNVPTPKVAPGNEFRFRYRSFWFKVCALTQTFLNESYDIKSSVIWLDADVKLKSYLTKDFLEDIQSGCDVAWLDRDVPWYSIESGFMVFRRNPITSYFMTELESIYLTGFLFDLLEWHDGFVLKALSKMYQQRLVFKNLNRNPTNRDAFKTSILDTIMEHYKGNLKTNHGS